MKHSVTISQLALLYLTIIAGGKFLALPSILAGDVGHDSWLVFVLCFAWEAIAIAFLLWSVKLNRFGLDIAQILQPTFKWGAKIFYVIFFATFILRANVLLISCYKMIVVTFDIGTNWIVYVLPIVAVAFLVVKLGFNSIARASQLLCALVLISVLALVLAPLGQVQFTSLFPIGEAGWGNIFATAVKRSFWFGDYVFIFFILGDIKVKKRVFGPVMACFAVGAVVTVVMNVVFMSISGSFAQSFDVAMSKIGVFSVTNSTSGRWDWLTLSVWLMSVFIKVVLYVFCAYRCVENFIGHPFGKFNWWTMAVIVALLTLPMIVELDKVLNFTTKYLTAPLLVVQYGLPLFLPLLTHVATRKREVANG